MHLNINIHIFIKKITYLFTIFITKNINFK